MPFFIDSSSDRNKKEYLNKKQKIQKMDKPKLYKRIPDFFRKILEGSSIKPPEVCRKAFEQSFSDASNVEWHKRGSCFEAIFYKENLEHIALFDTHGNLTEYKQFIPEGFLPETLREKAELKGEIMNRLIRNKGNTIEYEIIVRDKALFRYQLTFSDVGQLLEDKRL